jgi:hypothetical protein
MTASACSANVGVRAALDQRAQPFPSWPSRGFVTGADVITAESQRSRCSNASGELAGRAPGNRLTSTAGLMKQVLAGTDLMVEQKVEEMWCRGKQAIAQASRRQRESTDRVAQELDRFIEQQGVMKAKNDQLMQLLAGFLARFSTVDAADLAMRFAQASLPLAPGPATPPTVPALHHSGADFFMPLLGTAAGVTAPFLWPPMPALPKVSKKVASSPLPVGPPVLTAPTLSLAGRLPPPALSPTAIAGNARPQGSSEAGERTPFSIEAALLGHDGARTFCV